MYSKEDKPKERDGQLEILLFLRLTCARRQLGCGRTHLARGRHADEENNHRL
jgi:hypothetical protein